MFDPTSEPPTTWKMLKTFLKIALPAMMTNLTGMTSVIVSYAFAGNMDDPVKLASLGLTFSVNAMLVFSLLIGLNAA